MAKKNNKNVESFIEMIERNLTTNPAFKSLLELIGIILFFAVMIIVVRVGGEKEKDVFKKTKDTDTKVVTTTKAKKNLSLYEMLLDFETNNQKITGTINTSTGVYKVDASKVKGEVTGYLLSDLGNIGFKLKDGKVYEVTVDGEIENNELLSSKGISTNYLIPANIGSILSENKSFKEYKDKDLIFTYNLEGKTLVLTTQNKINSLYITEGESNYNLTFE